MAHRGSTDAPTAATPATCPEPVLPHVEVSRAGGYFALFHPRICTPIEDMRRPLRRVGDVDVNAAYRPHQPGACTHLQVHAIRNEKTVSEIRGTALYAVGFSHDEAYFAYAAAGADQTSIAWISCGTGECRRSTCAVNVVNVAWGGPAATWVESGPHLLCRLPVVRRWPSRPAICAGTPCVFETPGKAATPLASSAAQLEADIHDCCEVQPALIDVSTGSVHPIGSPDLYRAITPSPGGAYLLVERFLPAQDFSRPVAAWETCTEVWALASDLTITRLATLARQSEPRADGGWYGVPGRWFWHPVKAATLLALAGSGESGGAIVSVEPPFDGPPKRIVSTEHQCIRFFCTTQGRVILLEYDPLVGVRRLRVDTAEERGMVVEESGVASVAYLIHSSWDRNSEEAAGELRPVWHRGARPGLAAQHEDWLFVTGADRESHVLTPFMARLNLRTGRLERLFTSPEGAYQRVVSLLADDGSRFILACESPSQAARYAIRQQDGRSTRLGPWSSPVPAARVGQRIVSLMWTPAAAPEKGIRPGLLWRQFEVYLPPEAPPEGLPFLVWLSPWLPSMGIRKRTYRNQYLRLLDPALSPVLHGYGVAYLPPMHFTPSSGGPYEVAAQLGESASSIVETLVDSGLADRRRIAVGGYCRGAYIAVVLLQHTRLFCAGIACSGSYNLAAVPTGAMVTGQRRLWDDPHLFAARSPLAAARSITVPLLLVHGDRDEVVPSASSRHLFNAIREVGGTARYLCLPLENHRYECREYLDVFSHELLKWCDRHVKGITASTGGAPAH